MGTVEDQLQEMLRLSARISEQVASVTAPAAGHPPAGPAPEPAPAAPVAEPAPEVAPAGAPPMHGPRVAVSADSGMAATSTADSQRAHVRDLVERYTARTRTSKQIAQRYRPVLADSRAVVGFRSATKEMLYPIAAERARGSWVRDVDGNRYTDITMGFGILLFGHEPDFVTGPVREHLTRGVQLGPRNVETGEAAQLLSELTGMERVAFANSGTEANSAAIRLARNATGRDKIVMFHGAYHGHADNVLGRSVGALGSPNRETVPVSSGIPGSAVADLVVLDYGKPESLDAIDAMGGQLAAVLVEPVQSRNPSLQPAEFLRKLREITLRHGIVLLFDEMLTGFRPHIGGAQAHFGVTADLATYGKALGGGFPIGAIAGRADIMDGIDGGMWTYGDASYPPRDTTFYGGTYIQHPVSMVAARAVLTHLKYSGPTLQEQLNARTDAFATRLNRFFTDENFPLRISHFGSMFRFEHRADMELLYHHLLLRGVFVWEWRNFFLSTAHTDEDLEKVTDAVTGSLLDLRAAGFLRDGAPARSAPARAAAAPAAMPAPAPAPVPVSAPLPVPAPAPAPVPQLVPAPAITGVRPREAAPVSGGTGTDFSVYFFGDYPLDTPEEERYELVLETARFADRHGFHTLWMPERHFHSFGGISPNPAVLAAALARETRRIRLHAGSVVLPLHDPVRVAEEWAMVDALSGGRAGIGCAPGWRPDDFVFFPDRFGRHREAMYEQLDEVRRLWRGETVQRAAGSGKTVDVRLFPRPTQSEPPMFAATVGRPESYRKAARHDLGIVTNLMTQSPEQLAENIALYRATRAETGLDPSTGRVVVLLHTYLDGDHDSARRDALAPLTRYMRSSLSMFGDVTNSLGFTVDLDRMSEDDLDFVFERAYGRYCDQRSLIGSVDSCSPVVDALRRAGADEIAALVDFGVPAARLRNSMGHLDRLRSRYEADAPRAGTVPAPPVQRIEVATPATPIAPAIPAVAAEPEPDAPEVLAPLTPGQQRIWFLDRLRPGTTAYNEMQVVRLDGPLSATALRTAFDRLVERHGALRTVFTEVDGVPCQEVRRSATADFQLVDCTGLLEEDAVRDIVDRESRRSFDLEEGPLFLVRLLRLSERRHVLAMSMHHIIVDAMSGGVMLRDLSAFYRAETGGPAVHLPPLPLSYADFAAARAAAPRSPQTETDLAYWADRLGGDLPDVTLPADRPRPPVLTANGRSVFGAVDGELAVQVRAMSRKHRVTLYTTLLAALAATLRRLTGAEDIVIGTPVAERPEGTEDVVGFFLNTLALRFDLTGDPEFTELLGRVRTMTLDAYDHAGVPFEDVVKVLSPPRAADRTPVFQILAEYENETVAELDLPQVAAEPLDVAPHKALVDLTFYLTNRPQEIGLHVQYNTDLFDESTIEAFLATFRGILAAAVATPSVPLSRLGLEQEPSGQEADRSLHAAFAAHARSRPDAPAVVAADGTVLTYRQIDERADRFATVLRSRGAGPGSVVGLWLPRSAELVVAILAVLRTGGAYLPLDPANARQRLAAVVAESGTRLLVVNAAGDTDGIGHGAALVEIPPAAADPGPAADPAIAHPAAPDDPAYVIYTSGSTGRPKGVVVPHGAVLNLCAWQRTRFGFTAADRSAMVCSQSFDASVLELWAALTTGAAVAIVPDAVRLDLAALARWYAETGVTFTLLPTAMGSEFLDLPVDRQPPLRAMLLGGEMLRRKPRPGTPYEVVNIYGPTEATVLVTTWSVPPGDPQDRSEIPIGLPADNIEIRLLDDGLAPVAEGATGELYVGGASLARGYLNRPDLTAEHFLPDPAGGPGRIYRTGDRARRRPDGTLEFVGRVDDQVKIRGYRVEPGEATHALTGLDEVRDAVVVARYDERGEASLTGYVVPHTDPAPGDREGFLDGVRGRLAELLPDYLVPTGWVVLDALPLNGNGKLDRSALPDPADAAGGVDADAGPPPSADLAATEEAVRKLWVAELKVDPGRVTADSSFFELGGHSIVAMRLLNRVRDAFGKEYPMLDFFLEPTPGAMAKKLADTSLEPANRPSPRDRIRPRTGGTRE